eukprot:g961.t1
MMQPEEKKLKFQLEKISDQDRSDNIVVSSTPPTHNGTPPPHNGVALLQKWELEEQGITVRKLKARKHITDAVGRFEAAIHRRSGSGPNSFRQPPPAPIGRERVNWNPSRDYARPWDVSNTNFTTEREVEGAKVREFKAMQSFLRRSRQGRLEKIRKENVLALRPDTSRIWTEQKLRKIHENLLLSEACELDENLINISKMKSTRTDDKDEIKIIDTQLQHEGGDSEMTAYDNRQKAWNNSQEIKRERILMHQILKKKDDFNHQPFIPQSLPEFSPPVEEWRREVDRKLEEASDEMHGYTKEEYKEMKRRVKEAGSPRFQDRQLAKELSDNIDNHVSPSGLLHLGKSATTRNANYFAKQEELDKISKFVDQVVHYSEQKDPEGKEQKTRDGRVRITKGKAPSRMEKPALTRWQRRRRKQLREEAEAKRKERRRHRKILEKGGGNCADPNFYGLYNSNRNEVIYNDLQRHIRHEVKLASTKPGKMTMDNVLGGEKTKESIVQFLTRKQERKHRRQFGVWVEGHTEDGMDKRKSPAEQGKESVEKYLNLLLHRQEKMSDEIVKEWPSTLAVERNMANDHELYKREDVKKFVMNSYVDNEGLEEKITGYIPKDRKRNIWSTYARH